MNYRIETDSLGEIKVPTEVLWGAQTQRSLQNFSISQRKFPLSMLRAIIEIKRSCAVANRDFGVLQDEIAVAIITAADTLLQHDMYDQFPLDVFQTGSGTQTNMNVNEVISNLAIQQLGGTVGSKQPVHPNDHVNKGQSSNDVIPSAMYIAAFDEITRRLEPAVETLILALKVKSQKFANIIKIGRTHLQDAVPITLGQEFSGYMYQLQQALNHLHITSQHLTTLALGGTAVGTGLNTSPQIAEKAISELSTRYGHSFKNGSRASKIALLAAKDAYLAVSGSLKTLAVALHKIANDIRFLASGPRVGLGELILPANEPGSSIMPGKINPTQAEMLTQVCAQVVGNDAAITFGATGGYFELNLMKPLLTSNILESIDILTRGIISFTENCVVGIQANTVRIESLVEQSLMLATALAPIIGYDAAAQLAKTAYKQNKTIREVALAEHILSEKDLNDALNLQKMVNID